MTQDILVKGIKFLQVVQDLTYPKCKESEHWVGVL